MIVSPTHSGCPIVAVALRRSSFPSDGLVVADVIQKGHVNVQVSISTLWYAYALLGQRFFTLAIYASSLDKSVWLIAIDKKVVKARPREPFSTDRVSLFDMRRQELGRSVFSHRYGSVCSHIWRYRHAVLSSL
jgi:hypothetical protein